MPPNTQVIHLHPCTYYKMKSREWKKSYIEHRAYTLAYMFLTLNLSTRRLAKLTGLSKTTVHNDLAKRLKGNAELNEEVKALLHKHRGKKDFTLSNKEATLHG